MIRFDESWQPPEGADVQRCNIPGAVSFEMHFDPVGFCADCGCVIGQDSGPHDGWQLEDGRTVCQSCCAKDLRRIVMAANEVVLSFNAEFYWQDEQPDGTACVACGEPCYLTMHRYIVKMTPVCRNGNGMPVPTQVVVCGSCRDVIENENEMEPE